MFSEPQEIRLGRPAASRSVTPTTVRDEAFSVSEEPRVSTDLALAAGLREQLAALETQQRELNRLLDALES